MKLTRELAGKKRRRMSRSQKLNKLAKELCSLGVFFYFIFPASRVCLRYEYRQRSRLVCVITCRPVLLLLLSCVQSLSPRVNERTNGVKKRNGRARTSTHARIRGRTAREWENCERARGRALALIVVGRLDFFPENRRKQR